MEELTIIIPTYNRTEELLYNLRQLNKIFKELSVSFPIIIGDDSSTKYHKAAIEDYIAKSDQKIQYYYNDKNLGIEKNELKLLSMVKTKYTMLLGEDDYLNSALLENILKYVQEERVTAIIPNFYGINKYGEQIRSPRFKIKKDFIISKGQVQYFCYASQMSGLTFMTEGVYEQYKKSKLLNNSYPHLYFIACNLLRGDGVQITENPFQNTVLKKKQFDYSIDNLLFDILQIINALSFPSLNEKKKVVSFVLRCDITRYANRYTWLHPRDLFKKIDAYDDTIRDWVKKKIKKYFILSYLRAPFIVIHYFYVRRHFREVEVV